MTAGVRSPCTAGRAPRKVKLQLRLGSLQLRLRSLQAANRPMRMSTPNLASAGWGDWPVPSHALVCLTAAAARERVSVVVVAPCHGCRGAANLLLSLLSGL